MHFCLCDRNYIYLWLTGLYYFFLRGLFIIDPNGVVKHMSINDLPVGRNVEEVFRLVKAFQFVESHGEVCPASWTPNSPTVRILNSNQVLFPKYYADLRSNSMFQVMVYV